MINIILMIGGSCRTTLSEIHENYFVCLSPPKSCWPLCFPMFTKYDAGNTSFLARFLFEKRKK